MILCAPITLYHSNKMSKHYKNSEIHPAFACSRWPPWFPDLSRPYGACVKRGSGKHMFGLSLFRPSRQSNISTSGEERFKYPLPWENKISQIPYPQGQQRQSNLHPKPCPSGKTPRKATPTPSEIASIFNCLAPFPPLGISLALGLWDCTRKSGIICYLQCSNISKIMTIIKLIFVNYG